MRVTSYQTQSNDLRIETTEGTLQLIAYTASIVRVRYTQELSPSSRESLMIVAPPLPGVTCKVQETPDMLIFTTSAIEIQIQKETAAFVYRDCQGQVLTREPERGGKTLTPMPIFPSLFNEEPVQANVQDSDETHVKVDGVRQIIDRHAYHTRLEFVWSEGEALY